MLKEKDTEDDQKFEKNQISKNLSSSELAKAWFL